MVKVSKNLRYCQTDILGKAGKFSTVYKGTLNYYKGRRDLTVAVKKFLQKDSKKVKFKDSLLVKAKHTNILDYYITHGKEDYKFMAFEYCAGSLDDVVNGRCEGPKDPLQQITSGLEYLHYSNIVHFNLKPPNILVSFPTGNTPPQMKLADFGLYDNIKKRNNKDLDDWWPTENNVTPAFDVYCLGRIFCFFLSKGLFTTKLNFVEFVKIVNQVKEQEPLTFPWSVETMLELINSMLSNQPMKRPTASLVMWHPVFSTLPSPEVQQEAGPMAQNDDDFIVLPPPPKKVFEVVDVDSSGEEGETVDATFPNLFGSVTLVDYPLSDEEEDIPDEAPPDSNFSERATLNEEIPTPTAASKRTSEVVEQSQNTDDEILILPPPPKKICELINLEEETIASNDSSDSVETEIPHQSSEPIQEDTPYAATTGASVAGGRNHAVAPCTEEEHELLKLCGKEGLSHEDMARLLQLLTDKDVNINCCSKFTCNTPLMLICATQNDRLIPLVKALLQREDVDLTLRNRHGHNVLTLLCRESQNAKLVECVRLLVNRGIDVATKDRYNRSALHLLCQYYKGEDLIDIARLLIRADMAHKDLKNCVKELRSRKLRHDLLDDLIHSICRNEAEVLQQPNQPQPGLIQFQNYQEAEALPPSNQPLQPPPEVTAPTRDTKEVAFLRLCNNQKPVRPRAYEKRLRRFIEDSQMNLNCVDQLGRSPLLILSGKRRLLSFLLQAKKRIHVNHKDNMGRNALMIACENEQLVAKTLLRIVRQLVSAGIDITARNQEGLTALEILRNRFRSFNNNSPTLKEFVKILS